MIDAALIFMSVTWFVMLGAFLIHQFRRLHIAVMAAVITIDFAFPFYLFLTRDLVKRLFQEGEILSFLLWMHLMLVFTLYTLYVIQIHAGRRIWRGEEGEARSEHRTQGIAILVTRALVILSGGLIVDPPTPEDL